MADVQLRTAYSRTIDPAGLETDCAPVLVPNSAQVVFPADVDLVFLTLSNITGGAVTVTIKDQQGSPVAFMDTVSIAANSVQIFSMPRGRYFPGGMTWVAGSSNAIVGYARGRLH